MRLQGKSTVITGGASGLGEAIARRYVAEGAHVTIADIDDRGGRSVAASLGDAGRFVTLDVTQPEQWAAAMDALDEIDILVNNAGITTPGSIESTTLEQFRHEFEIDVVGVFLGCQAGVAKMKGRGGSIINMSSLCGVRPQADSLAYSAAKAAVTNMTKAVAKHCAINSYGIRCNSIHPGLIHTAILEKTLSQMPDRDEAYQRWIAAHPIGRAGRPEEIAAIAVYLGSDESAFATGAEFRIDGGSSI